MEGNMKGLDILKEEAAKKGIKVLEKTIVDAFGILKSTATRMVAESEGTEKLVGGILATGLSAFDSSIEKLADLDKDGKVG